MDKVAGAAMVTAGLFGALAGPVVAQVPGEIPQPPLPYVVEGYDPHRDPATDHPAVHGLLVDYFLIVKVNFDRENENAEFLEQYPQIHGYPHIFVLESDGTFLHSQDTAVLEEGRTYNEGVLLGFLKEWMPQVR